MQMYEKSFQVRACEQRRSQSLYLNQLKIFKNESQIKIHDQ